MDHFETGRRSRQSVKLFVCVAAVLGALVGTIVLPGQLFAEPMGPIREIAQKPVQGGVQRVIIDTDPGTDDALALLLAFNSPELKVEAITVVAGNVTAEVGLENALKIASLAGRCDIPIAKGAAGPLAQKLNTEEFWNGANGVGGAVLPATHCDAAPAFGPDLIIQMVHRFPHEITLIPIGPLTNIALAIAKDRTIVPLVKNVVLMGGSISGGNVNAASEFNIHSDPEAAAMVFNAGWPMVMVGLDVTERTLITNGDVARMESKPGPETTFAAAVARFQIGTYQDTGFGGGAIHDALAVGEVIDSRFLKTKAMRVDIETQGKFTRGATVANRENAVDRVVAKGDRLETVGVDTVQPNVQVAVDVDSRRFIHLFVERISGK
jgi:purine nucleosidase